MLPCHPYISASRAAGVQFSPPSPNATLDIIHWEVRCSSVPVASQEVQGGNVHTLCQAKDDGREAFVLDEMDSLQRRRLQRALRNVREDQPIWTQFYGQYK